MGEIIKNCEIKHAQKQTSIWTQILVVLVIKWGLLQSPPSPLCYVLSVSYIHVNVEFVLQVSAQAMQQVVQPTSPSESQATVPTITSQAYTSQPASVPIMSSVPQYINGHHVSQVLLLLFSRVKHLLLMDQEFKINDLVSWLKLKRQRLDKKAITFLGFYETSSMISDKICSTV